MTPAENRVPGLSSVIASIGAALIIGGGHVLAHAGQRQPLDDPRLVWIGDRSYSLYLWHWPVLMLAAAHGFGETTAQTATLLLLTVLVAMLSYRLIELPFWKGRFSSSPPIRTFAIGLGAACLVFASSLHALRTPPLGAPAQQDPFQGLRLGAPVIYEMGCDAWYKHARVELCVFGPNSASRTMLFIGDSIGAQWFSAFQALFPEPQWRIGVLTKSACPMVDEDIHYERVGGLYEVCTRWRNDALGAIEKMQPDLIVVGGAASSSFDAGQWEEGSRRVLSRLSKAARKVIVIGGTPPLGFHGPACIAREIKAGRTDYSRICRTERSEDTADVVLRHLRHAAAPFPNVTVLDLNDIVCPQRVCAAVSPDGIAVFRDGQHLNDGFVRARIAEIGRAFDRAVSTR